MSADETEPSSVEPLDVAGGVESAEAQAVARSTRRELRSTAADVAEAPRRRSFWQGVRDLLVIVVVAVLISTLLKAYVVRTFYIPSGSMEPTLEVGDRVLVSRLTPSPFSLQRGDVVVFSDPGGWLSSPPAQAGGVLGALQSALTFVGLGDSDSHQYLVKRVIALGGDHIVCAAVGEQITVNGVAIDETSYIAAGAAPCVRTFDVQVPEDSMWVMGDNRGNSRDSSFHTDDPGEGTVPVSNVVGRAFVITWPLQRFGGVDAHNDVFAEVPDAETAAAR